MSFDFDVIVVGSGFGGSVMTYRLAEKNYRVCLLERGKRYGMWDFPRRIHELKEKLMWDPKDGRYGFMEVRDYPESDLMSVCASGLGGGSLIYANVLMKMPEENFQNWPGGINRKTLDPYYDKVLEMMEASPYPLESSDYYHRTPKTHLFKSIAESLTEAQGLDPDLKEAPQFIFPHLAIRFEGKFPGHQTTNKHGALQSSCNKCGECDIGCNIHAKNTLDLNYIFAAQKLSTPAEVRTDALVEEIEALPNGGFRVTYSSPTYSLDSSIIKDSSEATQNRDKKTQPNKTVLTAAKVVLSAGSLGTSALMLKMKKAQKLRPTSHLVGKKWCGNGDLEGSAFLTKHDVVPTKGPVITGAIQYKFAPYPDGYQHTAVIQDAGFPVALAWYVSAKLPHLGNIGRLLKFGWRLLSEYLSQVFRKLIFLFTGRRRSKGEINIGDKLIELLDSDRFVRTAFILLGMGRDRNDGEIALRADGEPIIKWQIDKSKLHYDRVRRQMKLIAEKMAGRFVDNPLTYLEKIVAVHPIGGCVMGNSPEDGVIAPNGEVFGQPGLYIADASIIPSSLGPNPSLTIAAMAERIADQFPAKP